MLDRFVRAWTTEKARQEIVAAAGIEFDPGVVSAFLSLESMRELDSFAKPEVTPEDGPQDTRRERNLFASFMK